MDELARYNQARWDDLVEAGVAFSRPYLDLTGESARHVVDPHTIIGRTLGDIVLHPYSINFVPDVSEVFDGVQRVLRPGGLYRLESGNPLAIPLDERCWNGNGYPLNHAYADGEIAFDEGWDVADEAGRLQQIEGPRELMHTLGAILNGLADRGFRLLGLWEFMEPDRDPAPGTWAHFTQFCPPWYSTWLSLE